MTDETSATARKQALASKSVRDITYREWLIGQALSGVLASPKNHQLVGVTVADYAIAIADTTLKVLAEEGG